MHDLCPIRFLFDLLKFVSDIKDHVAKYTDTRPFFGNVHLNKFCPMTDKGKCAIISDSCSISSLEDKHCQNILFSHASDRLFFPFCFV